LSLEELEGPKTRVIQQQPPQLDNMNATLGADSTVFNMFLQSMKNAGQLPDKPSPAVRKRKHFLHIINNFYTGTQKE